MKHGFKTVSTVCAVFGLALAASSVAAQAVPCAPHEAISQRMVESGMALISRPLVDMRDGSAGQAEIWVAPDGQWIMIAVSPDGHACAAMSGTGWVVGERT